VSSKKTETATFRIEKDILDSLKKTAETENITLNALTNKVFSQFVKWDKPATMTNFVPLPKPLLIKMMDYLTDQQIIQLAEYMVSEIKDLLLVFRNENNVRAFMDGFESWAITSGFVFSHEALRNDTHRYVIQHGMGKKWSMYYDHVFRREFEELGISKSEFDSTEKTLVFNLTYKDNS